MPCDPACMAAWEQSELHACWWRALSNTGILDTQIGPQELLAVPLRYVIAVCGQRANVTPPGEIAPALGEIALLLGAAWAVMDHLQ